MKTVIYTFILAVTGLMLSGCDKNSLSGLNAARPIDFYWLTVNFKDDSGNDLVALLGKESRESAVDPSYWDGRINPELYQLDVILSNPHASWDNNIYNARGCDVNQPYFSMVIYNEEDEVALSSFKGASETEGYCYLFSNFHIPAINGIQDSLTYKIMCPTIFGDNLIHEITAYWKENIKDSEGERYPECIDATFDGKEVRVKKILVDSAVNRNYYSYFIDIVLD